MSKLTDLEKKITRCQKELANAEQQLARAKNKYAEKTAQLEKAETEFVSALLIENNLSMDNLKELIEKNRPQSLDLIKEKTDEEGVDVDVW